MRCVCSNPSAAPGGTDRWSAERGGKVRDARQRGPYHDEVGPSCCSALPFFRPEPGNIRYSKNGALTGWAGSSTIRCDPSRDRYECAYCRAAILVRCQLPASRYSWPLTGAIFRWRCPCRCLLNMMTFPQDQIQGLPSRRRRWMPSFVGSQWWPTSSRFIFFGGRCCRIPRTTWCWSWPLPRGPRTLLLSIAETFAWPASLGLLCYHQQTSSASYHEQS